MIYLSHFDYGFSFKNPYKRGKETMWFSVLKYLNSNPNRTEKQILDDLNLPYGTCNIRGWCSGVFNALSYYKMISYEHKRWNITDEGKNLLNATLRRIVK